VTTLTVWEFPHADGADRAIGTLEDLQKRELIKVHDGAIVRWDVGAKKPKTRQLLNATGAGALGGSFWGFLFGLVFLMPLLGMAIGAATGAMAGSLSNIGIDDDFVRQVREKVTPGTSALFVLTSDAVIDRIRDEFAGQDMDLIATNLSKDQEANLREVFGD
jgi:uncharacterized membrane protein